MDQDLLQTNRTALASFIAWLNRYGELSYDHQSFFAGPLGRAAKSLYYRQRTLGTVAVAPMVLCEALAPSARALFWKPQRFPIADAHYASGFAFLAEAEASETHYQRALHFLDVLIATRCPGYREYCWGYPFDWVTVTGTIKTGTPLITTVLYVYEAFRQVYKLDGDARWLAIMKSIAEHANSDYHDVETSAAGSSCSYTPCAGDRGLVVNASAYRACLLTLAAADLSDEKYLKAAGRNLAFVLESQNADGSWHYAVDGVRNFVDHFHTCFVLKCLAKIESASHHPGCLPAIERGVDYYVNNLFDESGLPKPFARRPRLTVYRRELYDYAECINVAMLLADRFPALDPILTRTVRDILVRWQKRDGSFRARQLRFGWDNTPMHRWAQAQLFRSLCFVSSRASTRDILQLAS